MDLKEIFTVYIKIRSQLGDCIMRTSYVGMECNEFTTCDLNEQSLRISYESRIESTSITTTASTFLIPLTESSRLNHNNTKCHHILSCILILAVVFIVILVLIIFCVKQIRSKANSKNRPFFCSINSFTSLSSSIKYDEAPILTLVDMQKQQTLLT
ncbi:unnamed protein product [Rotaria sp. Silwood1]|nr:unnamed protein product [Rotaria sp. Silwood1]CAF4976332.1 unnamed protein product [Rotaria sp. Silwood1]